MTEITQKRTRKFRVPTLLSSYGHSKGDMVASFHLDNPKERWLSRPRRSSRYGPKEIGSTAGHIRPNDLEDAARAWAAARVWNCAANRASESRRSAAK